MKDDTIGVVTVCYNTPELISKAVLSVYKYVDKVLIIDNSDKGNECFKECDKLSDEIATVSVYHTTENIGHGPALNLGITVLDTAYIICMDSDAELLDPSLIRDMEDALKGDDVYGSGRVLRVTKDKIPYLYLPFCMFKKSTFEAHPKFVHGGAPFIDTMEAIHKEGLRLVDIPRYQERLKHDGRGTRIHNPDWRKSFGGREGV